MSEKNKRVILEPSSLTQSNPVNSYFHQRGVCVSRHLDGPWGGSVSVAGDPSRGRPFAENSVRGNASYRQAPVAFAHPPPTPSPVRVLSCRVFYVAPSRTGPGWGADLSRPSESPSGMMDTRRMARFLSGEHAGGNVPRLVVGMVPDHPPDVLRGDVLTRQPGGLPSAHNTPFNGGQFGLARLLHAAPFPSTR